MGFAPKGIKELKSYGAQGAFLLMIRSIYAVQAKAWRPTLRIQRMQIAKSIRLSHCARILGYTTKESLFGFFLAHH